MYGRSPAILRALSCLSLGLAVTVVEHAAAQPPPKVVETGGQFKLTDEDNWKPNADSIPDPETPEGQLLEARRALAAGDTTRARRIAAQWVDRNERHPMIPEAYVVLGDAKLAEEDEYEALFDYEFVARMFPGTEAFVIALERELEIARMYAGGRLRKLWGLRILSGDDEAEELFIRIQERMPGSRLAEKAGMDLADFYFERRKMMLAVDAYALFIENYPRSDQLPKARRRLIFAHLASFKGPEYDAAGLYEARSRLQALRRFQPMESQEIAGDGLVNRIDESDAEKMLVTARWYLRKNDPIAAELTIRRMLRKYERTVAAADALRLIPEILPLLPERVRQQTPDYEAMRAGILGVAKDAQ